jgi:prepilin-type N-terminal cleavage/methylation domain-containing protein
MLPSKTRHGFTLVELLIVIAIIAVLMGLSLSVMSGLTSQAEQEATNATIRKLDGLLQQRMEAFDRAFTGAREDAAVRIVNSLLATQQIFGVRQEVMEILAKKRSFRFEFPQRFAERLLEEHGANLDSPVPQVSFIDANNNKISLPDSLYYAIAAPAARQRLADIGVIPQDDNDLKNHVTEGVLTRFRRHRPETESAELLYFALTSSTSYGVPQVDTDYFTNREVADTDGDGLPEFIDAWGFPLRFYRWPTRLIDITAPNPFQPVLSDPADSTDIRTIATAERQITQLVFRGLAAPPVVMPNGALPRDVLLIDPDDPVGRLYSELERLDGTNGKPLFALEFNEVNYHTPDTFHAPLIISAGPDEELGLREPVETDGVKGIFGNLAQLAGTTVQNPGPSSATIDALLDNISNLNRRAGARR